MKKEKKEKFISQEEMGDKGMEELLFKLSKTSYWQAILKFNRLRDSELIGTLLATDPFKNPTDMARAQGMRIGLYYVESKMSQLIIKRKKKEEGEEEEKATQGY